MPKSPFLKKNKPCKSITDENRRKQKFAIWDYYKKKSEQEVKPLKNEKKQVKP